MRLMARVAGWLGLSAKNVQTPAVLTRGRVDHVIIFDGTMTTLARGRESNAGLTYKILCEMAPSQHLSLRYETGIQWLHWRSTLDVVTGRGDQPANPAGLWVFGQSVSGRGSDIFAGVFAWGLCGAVAGRRD